ncbi:MAG: hypothetical protein SWJ54_21790 [Cyanobacteriota bacterium]|nr:hypothetical protein [Cyanobacteriota bacterium]
MTSESSSSTLLEQAAEAVITCSPQKPAAEEVVNELLKQEKVTSQQKQRSNLSQFVGTWRLCLITGTQKTRRKVGQALGAGRYIPNWIKIHLSYTESEEKKLNLEQFFETGQVENSVKFGALILTLSGPIKLLDKKNILAFDFTRIQIDFFGKTFYKGSVRGGVKAEEKFYSDRINKQAFFAYFYIQEKAIAARGRGGGLALWGREN